jgi:hypothetical protein
MIRRAVALDRQGAIHERSDITTTPGVTLTLRRNPAPAKGLRPKTHSAASMQHAG